MIHLVLTRQGYDQLKAGLGTFTFEIWVNDGVLSDGELTELRAKGVSVTNFTAAIDPADPLDVARAIDTIRQHHPDPPV